MSNVANAGADQIGQLETGPKWVKQDYCTKDWDDVYPPKIKMMDTKDADIEEKKKSKTRKCIEASPDAESGVATASKFGRWRCCLCHVAWKPT